MVFGKGMEQVSEILNRDIKKLKIFLKTVRRLVGLET